MQISPDVDIDLGQLFGAGTVTFFVMDWLKRTPLVKFINNNTEVLNRMISLGVAVLTATGIKFVSSGSLHSGGTLTITFPALQVIVNTLIHAAGQFGWQEMLHSSKGSHVMGNQILALIRQVVNQIPALLAAPAPASTNVPVVGPPAPPPPQTPGGH